MGGGLRRNLPERFSLFKQERIFPTRLQRVIQFLDYKNIYVRDYFVANGKTTITLQAISTSF
jgi:hypothetical protein